MFKEKIFEVMVSIIDRKINNIKNVKIRKILNSFFLFTVIIIAVLYIWAKFYIRAEMWGF